MTLDTALVFYLQILLTRLRGGYRFSIVDCEFFEDYLDEIIAHMAEQQKSNLPTIYVEECNQSWGSYRSR